MSYFMKSIYIYIFLGSSVVLYLCIPPFPAPERLVDKSYIALIKELGEPSASVPEKFIIWSIDRLGFRWSITVSYTEDLNSVPEDISRMLWVGPEGHEYPIVFQCEYSSSYSSERAL